MKMRSLTSKRSAGLLPPPCHHQGEDSDDEDEEFDLKTEWRNQFQKAILPEYSPEEGSLTLAMTLHHISFSFKVGRRRSSPPA